MKAKQIYISGPMTGLPDNNFPAFFATAEAIRQLGHRPINPAEGVITEFNKSWVWYMRHALRLLLDADEVWLLPGWQKSKGARLERFVAKALKMPVIDMQTEYTNEILIIWNGIKMTFNHMAQWMETLR